MPAYEIEHICPLSDDQQDRLAEAITKIHSEKFTAPRLFVNVTFKDVSGVRLYIGGKRRSSNRIIGNVRHGPSRTQEMYHELNSEIAEAWNEIVGGEGAQELRAIFILGSIVAGFEGGFSIAPAGQDVQWFQENYPLFKQRADAGDEDYQSLLEDIHSRPAFRQLLQKA